MDRFNDVKFFRTVKPDDARDKIEALYKTTDRIVRDTITGDNKFDGALVEVEACFTLENIQRTSTFLDPVYRVIDVRHIKEYIKELRNELEK
jgi:hypothetical protein